MSAMRCATSPRSCTRSRTASRPPTTTLGHGRDHRLFPVQGRPLGVHRLLATAPAPACLRGLGRAKLLVVEILSVRPRQRIVADRQPGLGDVRLAHIAGCRRSAHLGRHRAGLQRVRQDVSRAIRRRGGLVERLRKIRPSARTRSALLGSFISRSRPASACGPSASGC